MARRHQGGIHATQSPPYVQFSEEEQLRLIERTGTLKEIPVSVQRHEASSTSPGAKCRRGRGLPLGRRDLRGDDIVDSYVVLASNDVYSRTLPVRPATILECHNGQDAQQCPHPRDFYILQHKHKRWAQAGFFVLSVVSGTRMIYQVNYSNWLLNMQQCPPIGTIWVYTVLQLDLGPAALALSTVGVWVWWTGARLVFN